MNRDIVLNKSAIIERCIARIHEEYEGREENLENFTKQDSIILNIQRAVEASIDLAMHVVSDNALGVPQNTRDAFELIYKKGLIDVELSNRLKAMVGFRNIAVHEYENLDLEVVKNIIEKNLDDIIKFKGRIIKLL